MTRCSRSKALLSAKGIKRGLPMTTAIILVLFCVVHPYVEVRSVLCYSRQNKQSSSQTQAPVPESENNEAGTGKYDIPDLELLDQDGKRTLFLSQLLKGKVVAINFVYTSCTAFCAAQGAVFSKLQKLLGDKAGKSVNLITITTDPETDTPERLKAWSVRFGAKPGWTMLTGEKEAVDRILEALTGDIGRKGMHSPIVLIGNVDRGVWIRDYGLADPERLAATIEQVMTGKQ